MSPDDRSRLRHMMEAIETAQGFIAGRMRGDLDTDRMLLFALTRAVEIVGEAASKVSDAGRAEVPAIPWQQNAMRATNRARAQRRSHRCERSRNPRLLRLRRIGGDEPSSDGAVVAGPARGADPSPCPKGKRASCLPQWRRSNAVTPLLLTSFSKAFASTADRRQRAYTVWRSAAMRSLR
jgi:hypothetical protein